MEEDKTKIDTNRGFLGVKLITEASELLQFNVNSRFKAIVLFHNYVKQFDILSTVIATLNLANKLEEQNRSLKQIIYVVSYLKTLYEGSTSIYTPCPAINYSQYVELKEKAIKIELEILIDNNFTIQIDDLYGCFIREFINKEKKQIVEGFKRLNTVLFSREIIKLSTVNIVKIINNEVDYKRTVELCKKLKESKIDFITFKVTKINSRLTKSLLKNFIKRN